MKSNLIFVDLAGSERLSSQSKDDDAINSFVDDEDSKNIHKDRVRES